MAVQVSIRILFQGLALSLLLGLVACDNSQKPPLAVDQAALTLLNGEPYQFSQSPLQLINYWAPWCKPCLDEIPELNHFSTLSSIPLVGINFDVLSQPINNEQLHQQVNKFQIEFDVFDSASSIKLDQQLPRPSGLPATYLINGEGVVVKQLLGVQTLESIQAAIKSVNSETVARNSPAANLGSEVK